MRLTPTSDETWQWAWAVMSGKTFRCLPRCNYPLPIGRSEHALIDVNLLKYTEYHNAIAAEFPEYMEKLIELINNKEL